MKNARLTRNAFDIDDSVTTSFSILARHAANQYWWQCFASTWYGACITSPIKFMQTPSGSPVTPSCSSPKWSKHCLNNGREVKLVSGCVLTKVVMSGRGQSGRSPVIRKDVDDHWKLWRNGWYRSTFHGPHDIAVKVQYPPWIMVRSITPKRHVFRYYFGRNNIKYRAVKFC